MGDYDDLLALPHPKAEKPMARSGRAAQFAPFAALSGLDTALGETARLTERRVPLSEEECALLDRTLGHLQERLDDRPTVSLLCFEEDATKDGGRYVTLEGCVRRIDHAAGELVFDDGRRVPLDAICAISIKS